jgi:hypothetical protein
MRNTKMLFYSIVDDINLFHYFTIEVVINVSWYQVVFKIILEQNYS